MTKKMRNLRSLATGVLVASVVGLTLTACGDKALEQFQDAPIGTRDAGTPADIVNMPDGYANLATKCNNGNRVYVATTGQTQGEGGAARAIAVVANDPTCAGK